MTSPASELGSRSTRRPALASRAPQAFWRPFDAMVSRTLSGTQVFGCAPMGAALLVLAALCGGTARAQGLAQGLARVPGPDARPLLLAALAAADGTARGVLTGELADAITRRFDATGPLYIDVTTLRRYQQTGCARLNVLFWQDGVKLPGVAAPRRQTIEFGLNYCADGLPPRSLR